MNSNGVETLSKGYKQTKVGVIPEDWEVVKLGDVGEVVSGLTYSPANIDKNGVLVLRSSNVQNRKLAFNDNVFVNVDTLKFNPVQENDILICVRNGSKTLIGKNALVDKENEGVAFGAFMSVFRSKHNIFMFQLFDTRIYKREVHRNLGATINSINGSDLKKFKIPFPPIKEQQKIAQILTTWDDAISKQEELIKAKETLKKGLMQKLLSGKGKKHWKFTKLSDLLKYEQPTKYLVANKDYDNSYKIPVLTAGKTFILGYTKEENGIFKDELPVIIFDDFTTATKYVDFPFKAKSSAMKILKAKNESVNIKLVFEMMQMINYNSEDHKRYWISIYQELEIKFPPNQEQEKIAQVLTLEDKEIELLKEELETLKEQKRGLMQGLLSGGVRVKV
jgi:type I restriction enzyme S subunit